LSFPNAVIAERRLWGQTQTPIFHCPAIELARRVMEKPRHVLLVGPGAQAFALEAELTLVPDHHFHTAERLKQLGFERRPARRAAPGTVRAVARDAEGALATATQRVQWRRLPAGETPPALGARVQRLLSLDPSTTVS
jgi:hypothetical protein